MKRYGLLTMVFVAGAMMAATPSFAAEGAATGNGTSTAAGPAGDNAGPSKSGGAMMKSDSMKGGAMQGGAMKGGAMQNGAATGAGENKPTATGGEPGGGAGKN